MNDLMRPSLYGAVHPITRTTREAAGSRTKRERVDIVGPVCETGDCFLRDWELGPVQSGDVLAIWAAGAYGMSLASNYNGRPRAAEILVTGKKLRLIRRRETNRDLLSGRRAGLNRTPLPQSTPVLRFAPLQLVAQYFEIRFFRRLNQF